VLELVSRSMVPVRERTSPPVSDLDKIAAFGIGLTATHRWQITQRSVYSGLPSGAVAAAAAESDAAVADVCARMQRYHERYGERNHANGYAPHVHLGFPESPVEV
jgi:hypothetical protein